MNLAMAINSKKATEEEETKDNEKEKAEKNIERTCYDHCYFSTKALAELGDHDSAITGYTYLLSKVEKYLESIIFNSLALTYEAKAKEFDNKDDPQSKKSAHSYLMLAFEYKRKAEAEKTTAFEYKRKAEAEKTTAFEYNRKTEAEITTSKIAYEHACFEIAKNEQDKKNFNLAQLYYDKVYQASMFCFSNYAPNDTQAKVRTGSITTATSTTLESVVITNQKKIKENQQKIEIERKAEIKAFVKKAKEILSKKEFWEMQGKGFWGTMLGTSARLFDCNPFNKTPKYIEILQAGLENLDVDKANDKVLEETARKLCSAGKRALSEANERRAGITTETYQALADFDIDKYFCVFNHNSLIAIEQKMGNNYDNTVGYTRLSY
jgi:hypothetical protein